MSNYWVAPARKELSLLFTPSAIRISREHRADHLVQVIRYE